MHSFREEQWTLISADKPNAISEMAAGPTSLEKCVTGTGFVNTRSKNEHVVKRWKCPPTFYSSRLLKQTVHKYYLSWFISAQFEVNPLTQISKTITICNGLPFSQFHSSLWNYFFRGLNYLFAASLQVFGPAREMTHQTPSSIFCFHFRCNRHHRKNTNITSCLNWVLTIFIPFCEGWGSSFK